jgi:hypothetical protein
MSKPTCNICHAALPDYVDGKLEREEMLSMRAHLASSPECAENERKLRALFTGPLARPSVSEQLPRAGIFLSGVNQRIDRKSRQHSIAPARPSIVIPALVAVLLLAIAGVYFLASPDIRPDGDTFFSGLLTAEDLDGLGSDEAIDVLLREVAVMDLVASDGLPLDAVSDEADHDRLETQIDLTILGDIPYSSVVTSSLEYLSPYDIVDGIDTQDFEDIVNTLENSRFTLL